MRIDLNSYRARLDVALSVMLTAVSSLLAFATVPLVLSITLPLVGAAEEIELPRKAQTFALMESGADNWVEQPYAPMYKAVYYFENGIPVKLPTEGYFRSLRGRI